MRVLKTLWANTKNKSKHVNKSHEIFSENSKRVKERKITTRDFSRVYYELGNNSITQLSISQHDHAEISMLCLRMINLFGKMKSTQIYYLTN